MDIKQLQEEAKIVWEKCHNTGIGMECVSGDEYAAWISNCIQFLNMNFPNNPLTEQFISKSRNANGSTTRKYEDLVGIISSFEGLEYNLNSSSDIDCILTKVFTNFDKMARSIQNRHANRNTLEIKDEYDVQDLLLGILKLFVDDIRPEDNTPSYAGGNSRIDFHLPEYSMYIETKKTRSGLADRQIGEELLIDIGRYRNSCNRLICFVYDDEHRIKNPIGLIKDLEKLSTPDLKVDVYINPI